MRNLRIRPIALALSFGLTFACGEDEAVPFSTDAMPADSAIDVGSSMVDSSPAPQDMGAVADVGGDAGPSDPTCQDGSQCVSGFCVPALTGDVSVPTFAGQMRTVLKAGNVDRWPTRDLTQYLFVLRHDGFNVCPVIPTVIVAVDLIRCIEIGTSNRCARDCSTEDCPEGSTCTDVDIDGEVTPLCLPDEGTCEPCVDPDGDGYGNEGDCLGVDCDEEDPLSYEGAAEICDGRDNDCDTIPDNNVPRTSAPLDLACAQMGVCEGSEPACENAEWTCQYPDTFQDGGELTCDGLDNDCDGTVDEALAPPPANLVVGVCLGSTQVCGGEAGFGEPDYAQIEGFEAIETLCDGLDNDCDNAIDENIELGLAALQSGVCEGARKVCGGEGDCRT